MAVEGPGRLDSRGILQRRDAAGVNRFALGKHVGQLLGASLLLGEPVEGQGLTSGEIRHSDVDALARQNSFVEVNNEALADLGPVVVDKPLQDPGVVVGGAHVDALDFEALDVQHNSASGQDGFHFEVHVAVQHLRLKENAEFEAHIDGADIIDIGVGRVIDAVAHHIANTGLSLGLQAGSD